MPMFPPTKTGFSSARNISPSRAVVVVLPLEPVTPTIGPGQSSMNRGSMDQTGTPPRRAPATPRPTTVTRLSAKSRSARRSRFMLDLQRQDRTHGRSQDADYPQPLHHLRLAPAQLLEVVVQRRHAKDALAAAQPVVADLEHVGGALEDEDDADGRQAEPLAGHEGGGGQPAAQGESACIAHE